MAAPSVTYTFSNSTTADATQVNTNFTDLVNSLSDGLKDLTISSLNTATLTVSGAATFNGTVALGNATTDDVTITGYIASDILPKTTGTASLGSATQAWEDIYLDEGATNGGTIYFNAGTTDYIQCSADGATLTVASMAITSSVSVALTGTTNNLGTITSGVWNAGAVTSSGGISGTTGTFTGDTTIGSVGTVKQLSIGMQNTLARMRERAANNDFAISTNLADNLTIDDNTKSSWSVRFGAGSDAFHIGRAAATVTTFTEFLAIDSTGLLDLPKGQIKFPATQNASSNANTLDDYEESAYTVTDQSGAGLSITNNEISYTKIGNIVHFNFYITYPATANGSNSTISIPFTSTGYGTAICRSTYANTIFAWINSGATTLNFFTNGNVQLTNANLSTLLIQCSITYEVAT